MILLGEVRDEEVEQAVPIHVTYGDAMLPAVWPSVLKATPRAAGFFAESPYAG